MYGVKVNRLKWDDLFCHHITYIQSLKQNMLVASYSSHLVSRFFFLQVGEGSDMQPQSPGLKTIAFGRQLCVLWLWCLGNFGLVDKGESQKCSGLQRKLLILNERERMAGMGMKNGVSLNLILTPLFGGLKKQWRYWKFQKLRDSAFYSLANIRNMKGGSKWTDNLLRGRV